MMFWTDHDVSGWGWAAMVLGMVIFWGLLIALTVVLVRGLNRPAAPTPGPRPSPEQLLAERFAHGEIDEEEYRRRLDVLMSAGQAAGTA